MDNSDQPSSITYVNHRQMYPLPKPPPGTATPQPPFALLPGEGVVHSGHSVYGTLVLTNYRLYLQLCDTQHHVPVGLVEAVEQRDLFFLHVGCKDARTYRLTFDSNEACGEWAVRLVKAAAPPAHIEEMFAFFYHAWSRDITGGANHVSLGNGNLGGVSIANASLGAGGVQCEPRGIAYDERTFQAEVDRLKFNLHGTWRISGANRSYKLCTSYPPQLLVPAYISDEVLETVAKFRSSRRIPAVVWRHVGNGAVIARCSQPEVGWLGWRSSEDEELIKAVAEACTQDRGPHALYVSRSPASVASATSSQNADDASTHSKSAECVAVSAGDDGGAGGGSGGIGGEKKKVLIMDARSYTTAVANRARGGGCECPEYYPRCEIQFMNLANIHSIRKSFHALRQLCTSSADQPSWFGLLEGTRWLQHMSGLMKSAVVLVTAIERDARPVLVHCSDGWDRTPQIVALAELLLDPYYRTVDGFRILIEREWLAFGHKFADRCGHTTGSEDPNERCPVFLQWLDCVHQLLTQFPCAFEFSHTYLVKLAQHTYSNLYGTFLCNTKQERENFYETTFSVWQFLERPTFRNHLYERASVLWPQCNVRDLRLWAEVYLGSLESQSSGNSATEAATNGAVVNNATSSPTMAGTNSAESNCSQSHMTKTRSYGDLPHAADIPGAHVRRCSDPNIIVDSLKIAGIALSNSTGVSLDLTDVEVGNGAAVAAVMAATVMKMTRSTTPTNFDDSSDCKSDCIYKNDDGGDGEKDFEDEDVDDASTTAAEAAGKHVITNGKDSTAACLENGDMLFSINLTDEGGGGGNRMLGNKQKINNNHNGSHHDGTSNNTLETPSDECDSSLGFLNESPSRFGDDNADETTHNNGADGEDSDTEGTHSENVTIFTNLISTRLIDDKSVETSTETLVSENVCSSSSKEFNGFEKLVSTRPEVIIAQGVGLVGVAEDVCRTCAQKIGGKHVHNGVQRNGDEWAAVAVSGRVSSYSTPPQYSRTPSANGWDSTFLYCNNSPPPRQQVVPALDHDGLVPLKSDVQERLWHIIDEHRRKVEALQRELHTYRKALIKQVCHKCNHTDSDRNDETNSVVESICSAGEGQAASAVESLRSDMSWEAVDEGAPLADGVVPPHTTLWVPDHAVTSCTGCNTVFWLGRRKHHCRNCGNIFCADCSENSTPLPSEHLYDPVRVCTSCFSKLSREHSFNSAATTPDDCRSNGIAPTLHPPPAPPQPTDSPTAVVAPSTAEKHTPPKRHLQQHHHHHEQCKTHADRSPATTTNPRQITASSN